MKKFIKSTILLVVFFFAKVWYAQVPCPTCPPGGGGVGGTNPGARQSVPIDMYVFFLAIAAILMIVYFAKKYKTQKI